MRVIMLYHNKLLTILFTGLKFSHHVRELKKRKKKSADKGLTQTAVSRLSTKRWILIRIFQ